ncbi:MAG: ribosomal RNA small subunit methyltransferase A [Candidatus Micrarchaeota archaeon]|nr:ribosomal RNA small subunit methyltransferase A [Candidatus Micrarchaeota archaeon]MDE1834109.1 ribosomal RNA small subunit methyltransferase A [Candidatus Micrarchaeota archaeon]MDE1859339.1 ribosomal RNA small subunit methyltransferase A [Candidatus Micrarchaeota archaeon]
MYDLGVVWGKKSLGQVFLMNESVAIAEAAHSYGKNVIEIGPGPGILTKELCKHAKHVTAVEKDARMCALLRHNVKSEKLQLIHKDFLETSDEELELGSVDIVIANIPYNLSSRIIGWLGEKNMQAVLCLQKEFVDHMLAKPNTRSYSKLSVFTSLMFKVTKIMQVSKGNFKPMPKVDSVVIYIKPKGIGIDERELFIIGLMMQHKKKTVYNAILDSDSYLNMDRKVLGQLCSKISHRDERVFKQQPETLLEIARELKALLK